MGRKIKYTSNKKRKEAMRESVKKSRAKIRLVRKLQGLCTECGSIKENKEKMMCDKCREKYAECRRRNYEKHKLERGI